MSRYLTIVAMVVSYAISAIFGIALFAETGNRYSWMTELDPRVASLPADEDGMFRVLLFFAVAALSAAAGVACAQGVASRGLRIAARWLGLLLLVLLAVNVAAKFRGL